MIEILHYGIGTVKHVEYTPNITMGLFGLEEGINLNIDLSSNEDERKIIPGSTIAYRAYGDTIFSIAEINEFSKKNSDFPTKFENVLKSQDWRNPRSGDKIIDHRR